ncbi:MAG: WYL domain-containing protein [Chloroflexi bacterium]|nr:WYL domain-containing protein [Chloroflexota bacterium]
MQRWSLYLADLPASLLRLIAATHRISLPRRASVAERLTLVRQSLCRPAAVRAVYFSSTPEVQAAAQTLRTLPRCLSPEAVTAQFGAIRSLAELRSNRAPQTLAEQLLLNGWLLPRPAARNHPACYVVPPEVRAWLPVPLSVLDERRRTKDEGRTTADDEPWPALHDRNDTERFDVRMRAAPGCGGDPAQTLAVRAATAVLLAAAATPLTIRCSVRPTVETIRQVMPYFGDQAPDQVERLVVWIMPLLHDLGLLAPHGAAVAPAPRAAQFLRATPSERLALLRDAWIRAPRPEPTLLPVRASTAGLDWAALRRRLLAWAEASARYAGVPCDAYPALVAAFGPLADAHTHPFRRAARAPWNQTTAQAIWHTALHGPLAWLGACGGADAIERGSTEMWSCDANGVVTVPLAAVNADLLTLAPFISHVAGDGAALHLQIHRQSVLQAQRRGQSLPRLRATLERRCGALPAVWAELLAGASTARLVQRTVVLYEPGHSTTDPLQTRSIRRAIETVLAPGIALATPGKEQTLANHLVDHGFVVHESAVPQPGPAPAPADMTPAEITTLLVAGAHYRATAPADAPVGPSDGLLRRLRSSLPPELQSTTDALLEAPAAWPERDEPPSPSSDPLDPAALLSIVTQTIERRGTLTFAYQGRNDPAPQRRQIRPLRLERHGAVWYLFAYCLGARGERCFRLDRILGLLDPATKPEPTRRTSTIVSAPPVPPAHPLVRIWMSD